MPTELPAWAPTAAQVAGTYLPQRFGGGAPDANTVPTKDQVDTAIALRVAEVRQRCGRIDDTEDEHIAAFATDTVALGVASYLETTFWPEQQTEASIFLRMRYEEHITELRRQVLYHHRANL